MLRQPSAVHSSFDLPRCLGPLPLCPTFSDALDGRYPVEYYGPALPAKRIGDLSAYPLWGSACSFQRCSHSTFSASLRYLSVFLMTCEQAREAYP